MKRKGIEPLELHEKEGLALINGTQFMCSIVCEVASLAKNLLESVFVIYAIAVEVFGLDRAYFS
jgi:histidine ammonia-lyase